MCLFSFWHSLNANSLRNACPARTVADCLRYRSRVDVAIAIAALRAFLAQHRTGRDAPWWMAGPCRVRSVFRPYLESLS